MKKSQFLLAACAVISSFIFHPAEIANADSTTILVPGVGVPATDQIFVLNPPADSVDYRTYFEKDRSYECGYSDSIGAGAAFLRFTPTFTNTFDPIVNQLKEIGRFSPALGQTIGYDSARQTITPGVTGVYNFHVVKNSPGNFSVNIRFKCYETTLYGGYNTVVNPFNFLELTNTTNNPLRAKIRLYDRDGLEIGSGYFQIDTGRRFDFDVHTATGPTSYGMVSVTYDGTYGGLTGNLSQYNSDLELQATTPLNARSQLAQ